MFDQDFVRTVTRVREAVDREQERRANLAALVAAVATGLIWIAVVVLVVRLHG